MSSKILPHSFYLIWSLIFIELLNRIKAQQSYCWEPCTFNCPSAAPRLCPPEGILTYYDCCFGQGCCQYIKWPNLIFFIIIIIMLLSGCACCFCFMFTDARQRMFARQQNVRQAQEQEVNSSSIQSPPIRTSEASINQQLGAIHRESICSKSRLSSTPTSGLIFHKQSTIV